MKTIPEPFKDSLTRLKKAGLLDDKDFKAAVKHAVVSTVAGQSTAEPTPTPPPEQD